MSEAWRYTVTFEGQTTEIGEAGAVSGRSRSCEISVFDASVSRQHVRIVPADDALIVEDLGSSNGTFVNDQPIYGRTTLRDGDRLGLGDAELSISITPLSIEASQPPARGFGEATMFLQRQSVDLARQIEDLKPGETKDDGSADETPTDEPTQSPEKQPEAPFATIAFTPPAEAIAAPAEPPSAQPDSEPTTSPRAVEVRTDPAKTAPPRRGSRDLWPDTDEFANFPTPPLPTPKVSTDGTGSAALKGPRLPAAGIAPRAIAWLIDLFLLAVLGGVLWLVFGLNEQPEGWQTAMLAAALSGIVVLLAGWGLWGTTPGKRTLGLYVCTSGGQPGIGLLRASVRAAGWLLSVATLGIGFALAAKEHGLTLHDRIAGTYVGRYVRLEN